MRKNPNVLILYSDQHSAGALGCYGNTQVKTPNLDQLAKEGIRMNRAYTPNPICTPARMCMLSGQYAHNTGYYGLMGEKPVDLPNMFQHFRKNGYVTGAIGKLHTPAGWVSDVCDYVADGYGHEIPVKKWNRHLEEGSQGLIINEYTSYLAEIDLYSKRDDKVLHEWHKEYAHTRGQGLDARYSRIPKEHTIEMWSADRAINFIQQADEEEKPFMLWLTMPRPHQTYAAAKDFWDMYDEADINLAENSENTMEGRSSAAKEMQRRYKQEKDWMVFDPKEYEAGIKRVLRGYYACVTQMDDAMGKVLKSLDKMGIREDTIIVYLTDHGEFAGEHGMIEKAPGIGFGCVTRIPMIVSWKNHLPQNMVREELVEAVDVFPTVCGLADIDMPNWADGKNIVELLEADKPVRKYAITENPLTRTIHSKKYKLTQYLPEFEGKDFGELFDLENDPLELKNLYFDPEYQAVVQELRYGLYCWLTRTLRSKTVFPTIPYTGKENKGFRGISWDLARETGVYDEDGKIGETFYAKLLQKNMKNYL